MQLDPLTSHETLTLEKKVAAAAADFRDSISAVDLTSLLSDSLLLHIFSLLPVSLHNSNSLVCKRWLTLLGRGYLRLLDWRFLESGRLISRFPDLTYVDLVPASVDSSRSSGIFLTFPFLSVPIDSDFSASRFILERHLLPHDSIDDVLQTLARGCPNLRCSRSSLGLAPDSPASPPCAPPCRSSSCTVALMRCSVLLPPALISRS